MAAVDKSPASEISLALHRVANGSRAVVLPVALAHADQLYEVESKAVARAVDRRRAQFASGRVAARSALASLGMEASEIKVGPQREPLWPEGVVGAISHTNEWAVAWLGRATSVAGLGVDIETAQRLPEQTWPMIFCQQEIQGMTPVDQAGMLATAGFSVKESIYKAVFPIVRRFVDFKEVFLKWQGAGKGFEVQLENRISHELGGRALEVGFFTIEELVTSWAVLKD